MKRNKKGITGKKNRGIRKLRAYESKIWQLEDRLFVLQEKLEITQSLYQSLAHNELPGSYLPNDWAKYWEEQYNNYGYYEL